MARKTIYASPYELVTDEQGREVTARFETEKHAKLMFARAVQRATCFAAHLYFIDSAGQPKTLATYDAAGDYQVGG